MTRLPLSNVYLNAVGKKLVAHYAVNLFDHVGVYPHDAAPPAVVELSGNISDGCFRDGELAEEKGEHPRVFLVCHQTEEPWRSFQTGPQHLFLYVNDSGDPILAQLQQVLRRHPFAAIGSLVERHVGSKDQKGTMSAITQALMQWVEINAADLPKHLADLTQSEEDYLRLAMVCLCLPQIEGGLAERADFIVATMRGQSEDTWSGDSNLSSVLLTQGNSVQMAMLYIQVKFLDAVWPFAGKSLQDLQSTAYDLHAVRSLKWLCKNPLKGIEEVARVLSTT